MKKLKRCSVVAMMMCCFLASCGKTETYTVTWMIDGTPHTETYAKGDTPSYKDGTPTKASDKTNSYTFKGWDKDIAPVTGDVIYTAEFDSSYIDYTVTWVVDGVSTNEIYHYQDTPSFKGTTDKATDNEKTYTFKGWDKEIVPVVADTTYTAVYDEQYIDYTITWMVNGTKTEETYHYGETPSFKGSPEKAADEKYSYTFKGWDKDLAPVTENTTYTAVYDSSYIDYTVTWVVRDTTTNEVYHYGDTPSYKGTTEVPSTAEYSYDFKGWDKELTPVTQNVTYTATYEQRKNTYTITWIVDGKTTTDTVEYGVMPTAPENLVKEETDEYSYTFEGWDKDIHAVTGNETYIAKFKGTKKSYEITFEADGVELGKKTINYGEKVDASDITVPTKEGITFYGWKADDTVYASSDLPVVKGTMKLEAVYKVAIKVNAVNAISGEALSTQTKYFDVGEIYTVDGENKENLVADKDYVKGIATKNSEITISYSSLSEWDGESQEMDVIDDTHYAINNAKQFAYFANQVNAGTTYQGKTITLNTSLKINKDFPTIGTGSNTFQGIFEGNNCSIRGLERNSTTAGTALFFKLKSGKIQNLSVYGSVKGGQYVGGVVGRMEGGTLENITNYATVSHTANGGGGIAGGMTSGASIINSVNYGDITGTASNNKSAGICGAVEATGLQTIRGCDNFGAVKGGTLFGGIAGEVQATTSATVITECDNHGDISSLGTNPILGGIAGRFTNGSKSASKATLSYCNNYGNVTGANTQADKASTGGIAGSYVVPNAIDHVANYGTVFGNSRTGGIAGHLLGKLSSSQNYGEIKAGMTDSEVDEKGKYVGGLVGVAQNGSSISSSQNHGAVKGTASYVGGIVGSSASKSTVTITDCSNDGAIKAGTNGVGGIIGGTIDTVSTLKISSCQNSGEITGNNKVGGIAGCIWSTTSEVTDCTNTGTLTAKTTNTKYVGDLIGQNEEQYKEENAAA